MLATVLELLDQRIVSVDQVAMITFTNAAADVLFAGLQKHLAERSAADRYWAEQLEFSSVTFVGTIHGYCRQTLTRYAYSGSVARTDRTIRSARFLTEAVAQVVEANLASSRCLGQLELAQYELTQKVREVSASLRASGISPADVLSATERQADDSGHPYREAFALAVLDVVNTSAAMKAQAGVMDPDDLLQHTAEIVEGSEGSQVVAGVATRWPVLLMDEFQDTDRTQKRIIDALAPRVKKLVVVGDPKQSIYRFRGADVSLLERLSIEQTSEPPLRLPIARRPTHVLLQAQQQLLGAIRDRYPHIEEVGEPDPAATQPANPLVPFVYLRADRHRELPLMTQRTLEVLQKDLPGSGKRIQPGHVAVLVRSNRQVDHYVAGLQATLQGSGVRVVAEAGEGFYSRPAVVATYRVLAAALDHPNDALLSSALGTPYFPGVDPSRTEAAILQYNIREGAMLTDWLETEHPGLAEALHRLRKAVRTDTAPQFLARLYEELQIKDHFHSLRDEGAVDDLERLREQSRNLFRSEEALTVQIFTDWLRMAILRDFDLPTDDMFETPGGTIRVMTIHRAKGREFPIVFIPGMFKPLAPAAQLPWYAADGDSGLDMDLPIDGGGFTASRDWSTRLGQQRQLILNEEMRLLYVAITRAEHQVNFSGSNRRPNQPDSAYYSWSDEVLPALTRVTNIDLR
jgi:ATP-dependent exoDNAse (exonuclease V) beta subunit